MSNEQGIGAPLGGRVHWLLWCLSPEFKGAKNGNQSESGEAIRARAEASEKAKESTKNKGTGARPCNS